MDVRETDTKPSDEGQAISGPFLFLDSKDKFVILFFVRRVFLIYIYCTTEYNELENQALGEYSLPFYAFLSAGFRG